MVEGGRPARRRAAWMWGVGLSWTVLAVIGCSQRHGVEVSGAVTRPDGRVVNVGEVWLEPAGAAVADVRPARCPIRDGRYAFDARAGVLPGPWIARVQPPWPGPGASTEDREGAFKPLRREVTIRAAEEGANSFDFEIEPLTVGPPE